MADSAILRRRAPARLLAPAGGGLWRVRFDLLAAHGAAEPQGEGAPPSDLLAAAMAAGVTANGALVRILEGGGFARAPCLCCYRAPAARAWPAAAALEVFLQYYGPASYAGSKSFARAVETLGRDLLPRELARVQAALGCSAAQAAAGVCVVAPACRPGTLWVYSTPAGRRLLRHLARRAGPVRVTVASSDPATFARHRFRMYAVAAAGDAAAGGARLLAAATAWVEAAAAPVAAAAPMAAAAPGASVPAHIPE